MIEQQALTFLIVVVVGAAFAFAIWRLVVEARKARAAADALAARELAIIYEDVRATGFGAACAVLLVLVVVLTLVGYAQARTVFQQIEIGVGFIGGVILLGLGVALGRRRTYTVYRSEHREAE